MEGDWIIRDITFEKNISRTIFLGLYIRLMFLGPHLVPLRVRLL